MHSKHPLYKIHLVSPLSHKDEQHTEAKTSYKISELEHSISTKLSKFNQGQKNRRPVSLSFNLGKIMPKTITHDKQALYEQNFRLKENLKYLNNQIAILRGKVNISEHETQKVIQATYTDISKTNSNLSLTKQDKGDPNKPLNSKISWMWLQSQGLLKKEIIKIRQQNTHLKQCNQKLRKSLKYTQIQEFTIQNKHLAQQCARLKKILETKTIQNTRESLHVSTDLKTAKEELAKLKQQNTFVSFQLRSKVREIELLRDELTKVKERETKLEGNLSQLKNQIKGLIHENCRQQQKKPQSQQSRKMSSKQKKKEINNEFIKIQSPPSKDLKKQINKQATKQPSEQQNSIIYHYKNRAEPVQIPKKAEKSAKQKKKQETLQKIYQIRETLTYRFKSQRYTLSDLTADLTNTKLNFLSIQQLKGLLTSQPFFLKDQYLKFVLAFLFEGSKTKQQIEMNDFLQKIQKFVEQIDLIDEEIEETCLSKWKRIFYPIQGSLFEKLKENGFMTKSQFRSFVIEIQVPNQQIEILLGEASIASNSMNSINMPAFIQKMLKY